MTAKIRLQHGEVHERVLVEEPVTVLHCIVEVTVKGIEGSGIVAGTPRIEEAAVWLEAQRSSTARGVASPQVVRQARYQEAVVKQVLELPVNFHGDSVAVFCTPAVRGMSSLEACVCHSLCI